MSKSITETMYLVWNPNTGYPKYRHPSRESAIQEAKMSDLLPITLLEQIAEVQREIQRRERVYPSLVMAGKMTQDRADRQTDIMRAALKTLESMSECDCTRWGDTGTQKLSPEPDLREAVARAICEATGSDPDRLVNKSIPMWEISALKEADAAIAVVVGRCAAQCDDLARGARKLEAETEHKEMGRERATAAETLADEIRALARKEG